MNETLTTYQNSITGSTSDAHNDSLESLQAAYEDWLMATGVGVGLMDLFWSWHIQA